jgi:hypothetical protein
MWVELQDVTRDRIAFSLESEGRYRNDMYYVGNLKDPHTGKRITDRQLELRLHTVGMNPQAKRHADLIMEAYPMLREKTQMDVPEQLAFLYDVIDLCPGNEEAWTAVANMSRDGVVTLKHNKAMLRTLERLFVTFEKFPDFTWTIFDDLITYQSVRKQRERLYGRLLMLYVGAGRPDLACKARLKYTEYLVADERHDQAIQGLQATIMAFPEEGRYVPQMLDKMEEICRDVEGRQQQLVEFYQALLPRVPKRRGNRASGYCMKMYERAIDLFNRAGQLQAVQYYESQLAQLRAGPGG